MRKIREMGLSVHYRDTQSRIGYWLKHIHGLAFLSPSDVLDTYVNTLLPAVEECPELKPFSQYFMCTYASETARFPPALWARFPTEYGIDTPSTTNGCKSFHKHLKLSHPKLYTFSAVLLECQELMYIKQQSFATIHHNEFS